MFWVALSVLIMNLTGSGDDTFVIRKFLERLREAVEDQVHDAARRRKAIATIDRANVAFRRHRERVGKISACLERADRSHAAVGADYQRCLVDARPAWDAAAEELIVLDREFRAALTSAEFAQVRRSAKP
jgi:hypothetical protein